MPMFILPPGARKLPDSARHCNRFQIRSDSSDRLYTIAFDRAMSRWTCGCGSYIYAKGRPCKHLLRLGLVGSRAPEPGPRRKRSPMPRNAEAEFLPAVRWTKRQVAAAAMGFAE